MPNTLFNIPGQDRIDSSAIWPKSASDGGYLLARLFFSAPVLVAFVSGFAAGSSYASAAVYGRAETAGASTGSSSAVAIISGSVKVGGTSGGSAAALATLTGVYEGQQDAAESVYLISRVRTGYTGISKVRMSVSALLPSNVFTEKQIVSAAEKSVNLSGPVRISFTAKSVIK